MASVGRSPKSILHFTLEQAMTQNRKGFTLIELLIVVVIIGILAAIAIPKFSNTKQQAYLATLKSDLRNLVTAEEAYFADNETYTTALSTTQFDASQGVTYSVSSASGTGWEGTATHVGLVGASPSGCHIAIGTDATTASEDEGAPYCP
jgi:type IV pilus assembly protein PilA